MSLLEQAKRVVIKLGTGVLTSGIGDLDTDRINILCKQVIELRSRGVQVVLVSSGAVGLGMGKLNLKERPEDLAQLQACASVGQSILIILGKMGSILTTPRSLKYYLREKIYVRLIVIMQFSTLLNAYLKVELYP